VDEETLEHGLDVLRLAEDALEPRAAAPRSDDGEVTGARVAEALPVEHERHARHEVRLADDELAALLDLDDGAVGQLDLEEAPDREARAGGAEQQAGADEDEGVQLEGERPDVVAGVEGPGV
jgi:hypothetical protein